MPSAPQAADQKAIELRAPALRLYWITGCSSCMRVKEFLTKKEIPFESINLAETPTRGDELTQRGIRALPVLMRGEDYTLAQSMDDIARFVGSQDDHKPLSPEDLVKRADVILDAASENVGLMPPDQLDACIPGRDRPHRDLMHHVFHIVTAFVDTAEGGELKASDYAVPADRDATPESLAKYGEEVRARLHTWWNRSTNRDMGRTVLTFYGEKSLHEVLERTVWHSAHHARQIERLVLPTFGLSSPKPLKPETLQGLPLPDNIF